MPSNDNKDDHYIDNPLCHLGKVKEDPIFWSSQALSLMETPNVLPIVPIPSTAISDFSHTAEAFGLVCTTDALVASQEVLGQRPYRHLRVLAAAIAGWFSVSRDTEVVAGKLHPKLNLGGRLYSMKAVHLLSCLGVPSIAYLDAPHRSQLKGKYRDETIHELLRLSAIDQNDDALEPFDFAMLIALAQEHRFFEVKPDPGGYYTTRIFYPDSTCKNFIIVTAKVMAETLEALENKAPLVRKVKISKYTVPLGEDVDWEESRLLQVMATILDDGIRAATTAVTF